MRDSYDYLIHLIRCAIHDYAPSDIFDGAVFDSVYVYGAAHDIANIASYSIDKLESGPDGETAKKFIAKRNSAVYRDMNQDFAREELVRSLEENGIPWVEVQGTVIKQMYPKTEYRTMSDIDIIVPPAFLTRVKEILQELEYECSEFRGYDVNAYRDPDIHFEIHTAFFSDHPEYEELMSDPFEGDVDRERLLYLYNVLHTAKHYFHAGCGIRRVLDLYYLNRNYPHIANSTVVLDLLEKAELKQFVQDMSELAECWFGETERDVPDRLRDMADTIKRSGIHGTESLKVQKSLEREKENGAVGAKTRYVLRRLFPEKWVMDENYPILRRCAFLYPFCLVHRAAVAALSKRERIRKELRNLRDSDKK